MRGGTARRQAQGPYLDFCQRGNRSVLGRGCSISTCGGWGLVVRGQKRHRGAPSRGGVREWRLHAQECDQESFYGEKLLCRWGEGLSAEEAVD
jgi:hypothetical protein